MATINEFSKSLGLDVSALSRLKQLGLDASALNKLGLNVSTFKLNSAIFEEFEKSSNLTRQIVENLGKSAKFVEELNKNSTTEFFKSIGSIEKFCKAQQAVELYLNGSSVKQVADRLHQGKRQVNQVLRDADVLRYKHMTPETEAEIVEAYKQGSTQSELHRKYNCTSATIRNVLKRNNVEITPWEHVRLKPEQVEELRDMWNEGVPRREILRHFKTSGATLNRWIKLLGEPLKRSAASGEKHGSWKGGRIKSINGYISKWISPDDPLFCMANSQGYTPEHRYVMAKYLDRPLRKEETVHHINGDRTDNRLENLQLRIGQHGNGQCYRCCDCGSANIEPIELEDN